MNAAPVWQLNMFGPPEAIENLDEVDRIRDDAPVPCERELLWPAPHVEVLGVDLLERLYGDIPRRTRLTVQEVCRRIRCCHSHAYVLVQRGSLDSIDNRDPKATQQSLRVYRYSLVRFLFNREFVEEHTRCGMPAADLDKCLKLAETLRNERRTK